MGHVIEMPRREGTRWRLITRSAGRVLVVSAGVDAQDAALVRSLRADPTLAGVPLLVFAPCAAAAQVQQLLESGASVVVNADAFAHTA